MRSAAALRRLLLLGALPAAATLLAGCSGLGASPPLGDGVSGGRTCTPAPQVGKPVSMVLFDLDNKTAGPVTVRGVSLPNAHGMAMTEAWLVPLNQHGPQMGVGLEWPPTRPIWASQWAAREPAIGGVIRPGQVLELAFGVIRTTAADGYSDGPMVVYTAGRSSYTLREQFALAVARTNCNLSPSPFQGSPIPPEDLAMAS